SRSPLSLRRIAHSWYRRRLLLPGAADSPAVAYGPDGAWARAGRPPAHGVIRLPPPRAWWKVLVRSTTPVADHSAFRWPAREIRCAACATAPGAVESQRLSFGWSAAPSATPVRAS